MVTKSREDTIGVQTKNEFAVSGKLTASRLCLCDPLKKYW